jgi:predicted NBD/HSP70 family sugar kinase
MRAEGKTRRRTAREGSGRFKIKRELIAGQEAELLQLIRSREGLSRIDLARTLKLAPSTIGIYVDHLVSEGFIFEGKKMERDFGRPPTILALNPQGGRFIGIDFEARNIMAVAVDFSQRPLKQIHETIAAGDSVEQILGKIEDAIKATLAGDDRRVLGIGVGVPGTIDPVKGVALHYQHIKGWNNVPLVARLSERFRVPVFLENNIRTMALAELWFGQGRGSRDFICLGVRSGIAAGIIVDGQIYHGANNRAGQIREWPCALPVRESEILPTAPSFATLEETASFQAIRERLARHERRGEALLNTRGSDAVLAYLLAGVQEGDREIITLLEGAAETLALVITQLNTAFNPEKFILAGVFTALGNYFLERLQHYFRHFAPADSPRVINSELGDFNGALGAAALAVHQWKPVETKQPR